MPYKDKEQNIAYHKNYNKEWYDKNKKERQQQIIQRKKEIARQFQEYKQTLSCSKCGFSHPAALDFHHREPSKKDDVIAYMIRDGKGWDTIMREIGKCDVLCSNCHRILHYSFKDWCPTN